MNEHVTHQPPDDLDPDLFIARAQQAWQVTAEAAKAEFLRARGATDTARAAIRLAEVLRGPGLAEEATEVLHQALAQCRQPAAEGEPRALEAFGDILLRLERKQDAVKLYGLAAKAGSTEAIQRIADVMFDAALVGAGSRVHKGVRTLPQRQQQVLALTGMGTTSDYEFTCTILKLSPDEVRMHVRHGQASLVQLMDPLEIDGTIRRGSFDPEFEDPANMPGQVLGGTLTNDERAKIQRMDPKDRARYLLEKRISEKAEMAVLLSQLHALHRQDPKSVVEAIAA